MCTVQDYFTKTLTLQCFHAVSLASQTCKLEKLLDPSRSRMVPLPGTQIYFRPQVTLTFDLLHLSSCRTQWAFTVVIFVPARFDYDSRNSSWEISPKMAFVTFTWLDLWPPDPKVDHFVPLSHKPLVPICSKIGSFICYQNTVFTGLLTDKDT